MKDVQAETEARYPIENASTPEGATLVYAKQAAFVAGAEWATEDDEWEYVPGHRRVDAHGVERWFVQSGIIATDYVDQYIKDGGQVIRRKVGPWEVVGE